MNKCFEFLDNEIEELDYDLNFRLCKQVKGSFCNTLIKKVRNDVLRLGKEKSI